MANTNSGWKKHSLTVLSFLLALAFLFSGGTKLAAGQMHVDNFARWGYPTWFMYVTGLVEVSAALLLLAPRTHLYGAGLLVCTMLGAVFTHLTNGEANMVAAPLVLLLLAGLIAWAQRPKTGAGEES